MEPKAKYCISEISEGLYELSHGSTFLCRFSRENFREVLEQKAIEWDRSSKWIGSILHIFNKTFPPQYPKARRTDLDRLVCKLGNNGIADYLRSKGFRVVQSLAIDDIDLIRYMEKQGYVVEGFIGDVHYATDLRKVLAGA